MEDDTLGVVKTTRFFKDTQRKIDEHVAAFPEKFENDSHFIRCAVNHFCRHLANEETKQ